MTEYPYYIRTLTKEPSIPLLNYLYQKNQLMLLLKQIHILFLYK